MTSLVERRLQLEQLHSSGNALPDWPDVDPQQDRAPGDGGASATADECAAAWLCLGDPDDTGKRCARSAKAVKKSANKKQYFFDVTDRDVEAVRRR